MRLLEGGVEGHHVPTYMVIKLANYFSMAIFRRALARFILTHHLRLLVTLLVAGVLRDLILDVLALALLLEGGVGGVVGSGVVTHCVKI